MPPETLARRDSMKRRRILAVTALIAFAVLIVFARSSCDALALLFARAGEWRSPWAPVAFVALYAAANALMIPATPLTLAAGVIWGWWKGGLLVLLASTVGSIVPYVIARSGAAWAEGFLERRAGWLKARLKNEGFLSLLLMRLVPVFPYNVLNYAAGLAGIRPRDYLAATFIGTIPAIFTYTFLADSIRSGIISPRDAFLRILFAGALLGLLSLVARAVALRLKRREERS